MTWTQVLNPLGNMALSALLAALPIGFYAWALAVRGWKGPKAALVTLGLALVVGVAVFGTPPQTALGAALYGACYGILPIGWIVVAAVFLYNLTVGSGAFEVIKRSLLQLTSDPCVQVLLVAYSFGAFLEGAAGFGTPVAISAAMLIGLGFPPLKAAMLALVANTAPVAFGGIGIPAVVGAEVAGLDPQAVSRAIAQQLPVISLTVPFLLVFLVAGRKGLRQGLPAATISALSFTLGQWGAATFHGPMLADMAAALLSAGALVIYLKLRPAPPAAPLEAAAAISPPSDPVLAEKSKQFSVIQAWSPFVLLTLFVAAWGVSSIKHGLDQLTVSLPFPGLDGVLSATTGLPLPASFKLNLASTPGTAIFLAALCTLPLLHLSLTEAGAIFRQTLRQLRLSLLAVCAVLGFAQVANFSGMSSTLGVAMAGSGGLFPLVSPLLGWLGVFITGSDTSSNALFCKLQEVTATRLNLDPITMVAANTVGGGTGKMISPQSIAIAAGTAGLSGQEAALFRLTWRQSLLLVALVSLVSWMQARPLTPPIARLEAPHAAQASAAPSAGPAR